MDSNFRFQSNPLVLLAAYAQVIDLMQIHLGAGVISDRDYRVTDVPKAL